jgi:hypothetical protein
MDTNKKGRTDLGIYKNTERYEKHAGEKIL